MSEAYYTPSELRHLADRCAWSCREQLQALAATPGEFAVLVEMDEVMLDINAENVNHRWDALDRAWDFIAAREKRACAGEARALLRLRVIAENYHQVLTVEALERVSAAEESREAS
jgi:hypothetical protein